MIGNDSENLFEFVFWKWAEKVPGNISRVNTVDRWIGHMYNYIFDFCSFHKRAHSFITSPWGTFEVLPSANRCCVNRSFTFLELALIKRLYADGAAFFFGVWPTPLRTWPLFEDKEEIPGVGASISTNFPLQRPQHCLLTSTLRLCRLMTTAQLAFIQAQAYL